MKNKKIFAILLTISMLASMLVGCSVSEPESTNGVTAETLMGFAKEVIMSAESIDLEGDMTFRASSNSEKEPVTIEAHTEKQLHFESGTMHEIISGKYSEAEIENFEEETYVLQDDGKLVRCHRDNNSDWEISEEEMLDVQETLYYILYDIIDATEEQPDGFILRNKTQDEKSYYFVSCVSDTAAHDALKLFGCESLFEGMDLSSFAHILFHEDTKMPYAIKMSFSGASASFNSVEMEKISFDVTLYFNSINSIDEITAPDTVMAIVTPGNVTISDGKTPTETEPAETEPTTEPSAPESSTPATEVTEPTIEATTELTLGDWKEFKFALNGTTFTLPCSYEELKASTGLSMRSAEEKSYLEPDYYTFVSLRTSDDTPACSIDVLNDTEEDATYSSCKVIEISQTDYNVENNTVVLEIAGLKVSDIVSKEMLIDAFGEPDDLYEYRIDEDDDPKWLEYETDTYTWCLDSDWSSSNYFKVVMNIHTGIIEEIRMDHSYFD